MPELLWTKEFKERFCNHVIVVPELRSVFYLNGSNMYAGMKIRRLDMHSGEELANFLTRAHVYDLAFSTDFSEVIANTERRLFLLSSMTLSEILRCETRVPANTTSMLHLGRMVAMKGFSPGTAVSMYDLNSKQVKRIKLRAGVPLYRDIHPETFLACCSKNGSVWRINLDTYDSENLLAKQLFFDGSAINHESKTLWLSEESMNLYELTNKVHRLSLVHPFMIEEFALDFHFKKISVTADGNFLWVARETRCDIETCSNYHRSHVCVLSIKEGMKQVKQFEIPDEEDLGHMDAPSGLIFTERRFSGGERFKLTCWKI